MTRGAAAHMLGAMRRRRPVLLLLALTGLAMPICTAQAAGLPCQPCAGLRLEVPPPIAREAPAPAAATAPASPAAPAWLRLLRSERLPPGSPLFIAWEVPLPAAAAGAGAAVAPPAAPGTATPAEAPGAPPAPATATDLAAAGAAAREVAAAGATPWLSLIFSTPAPVTRNLARLQAELAAAAEVAAAAPRGAWFQVVWRPAAPAGGAGPGGTAAGTGSGGAGAAAGTGPGGPAGGAGPSGPAAGAGTGGGGAGAGAGSGGAGAAPPAFDAADYAFLLKRAAVAVSGAQANVHVATEPLAAEPAVIAAFYGAEVTAYVDVVALAADTPDSSPAADSGDSRRLARLTAAAQKVRELDPGRPVALDALPYSTIPPGAALLEAARYAAAGFDLTLFRAPEVTAAVLNPLALLAREFAGDLSYDAASAPSGAAESWVFVRGKDLALRVIALLPAAAPPATPAETAPAMPPPVLHFPDPNLRRPTRFPFAAGPVAPPSATLTPAPHAGLDVVVPDPAPVVVLGIERLTAAERQGVAEKLTVASEREMPVEEILKRLQVFEDAQNRRLADYTAINTTHLRFQPNAGAESIEASLAGPFFWSREGGADWAWETLYLNGVRWRGKTLPEIPLIQPEKAAALPLEIHFTREYRYRLRGTEKIAGRDAWVVDFAPAGPGAAGRRLYQGTVWIDRALYARLRTRAVQLGLQGEVTSNEETLVYSPVDAQGQSAAWSADAFVLPLELRAQQILSVLDTPLLVERATVLTQVQVNPPDFAAREQTVEDTDVTMVRDTDQGLRYLVKKGAGPRLVKQGIAPSKLFALGGLFVDDSLNYPLPLAGVNYFSFDFKNTGKQTNVFFAGLLLIASASEPRLGGSRFDAGGDLFAIAVSATDDLYHQGKEQVDQEVKIRPAFVNLKLGHPLGDFFKVGFTYGLLGSFYGRNSNTSRQFVLPSDNLLQSFSGSLNYSRAGYTLVGSYSYNLRSTWHPWGLPGNPDYSPADRNFARYGFRASKNWYLRSFQKLGAEVDYFSGDHLDRFSKYEFGFFGGTRVHGYRSNAVRASEAYLGHLSYGFDFGDVFRLDALADVAFATDKLDGLHDTLLAGTGVAGSLMGPWQTLVTLDVGLPVAGPDHGFVLYLVFLKLFR